MAKYIDNKQFNIDLTEYLMLCEECEKDGKEIPQIPRNLAESFQKIATGLSTNVRFSRYTFIDDMISDGVLACITKIIKYDFRKYNNPFAYFTQICWFEFIGRIGEEYNEKKAVYRACEELSLFDFHLDADDVDTNNQYLEFLRENIDRRELERMQQPEDKKKFVHRMVTKKNKQEEIPDVINTSNALVFS